jgi:hypothetical protein
MRRPSFSNGGSPFRSTSRRSCSRSPWKSCSRSFCARRADPPPRARATIGRWLAT